MSHERGIYRDKKGEDEEEKGGDKYLGAFSKGYQNYKEGIRGSGKIDNIERVQLFKKKAV